MATATKNEPQIGETRKLSVEVQCAWECLDNDCGALNLQDVDGACIECGGMIHKVWAIRDEDREIDLKVAEVQG